MKTGQFMPTDALTAEGEL